MALSIKHQGFGRWLVLDDEGGKVAGPFAKEEAEAYILSPPQSTVNHIAAERDYWRRVNADLARPITEELTKLKAVLDDSPAQYTDIEQAMILRGFEAILKNRGRVRRRSHNTVLPDAQAQVAA